MWDILTSKAGKSILSPHDRQTEISEIMRRFTIGTIVLLLALVLAISGCDDLGLEDWDIQGTPSSTALPEQTPKANIVILSRDFTLWQKYHGMPVFYYWTASLRGEIRNDGNAMAKDVWIQVIFYDAFGWECPGQFQFGDVYPGQTLSYVINCDMVNKPVDTYKMDIFY